MNSLALTVMISCWHSASLPVAISAYTHGYHSRQSVTSWISIAGSSRPLGCASVLERGPTQEKMALLQAVVVADVAVPVLALVLQLVIWKTSGMVMMEATMADAARNFATTLRPLRLRAQMPCFRLQCILWRS